MSPVVLPSWSRRDLSAEVTGWARCPAHLSWKGNAVNKGQLVDALEARLGTKKAAAEALEAVVDTITVTVAKGGKVAITGFGTFERAARAARTGRNPRTGEPVKIKKTSVPRFRAGTAFKSVTSDVKALRTFTTAAASRAASATTGAAARIVGTRTAAGSTKATTATKSTASKTTAKKATATKAAAKPAARKSATKVAATKAATTKRAVATKATPAKKTTAKAGSAAKTTTKAAAATTKTSAAQKVKASTKRAGKKG